MGTTPGEKTLSMQGPLLAGRGCCSVCAPGSASVCSSWASTSCCWRPSASSGPRVRVAGAGRGRGGEGLSFGTPPAPLCPVPSVPRPRQGAQLQEELRILKENFSHFSSGVFTEMGALSSHGGNASDLLTSLEAKLEKQQKDLEADHATLLLHLKHFPVDLRILTCQMAFFRSNGTECCPVNWLEFEGSCYWFSRSGKTWPEAEKHCRLENAHLAVVNSREEQVSRTAMARGSGWMAQTIIMATRTGPPLSQTTGRATRWEEAKTARKSAPMAAGMTISASRCSAGCAR
ncbi:asialoglycoprotein receptor 2 isoform X3 [Panthera tigris]|uniref:asialoglycoprotein receptor 2 isoform X3 n=1 Tax=Panthera tigris TaxID=9694 RepID=UPI001C6F718C|nr:asialoglycoprotein receptor 2 isoform X3 [Panthera tigris]